MQLDLRQIDETGSHRFDLDAATIAAWSEGLACEVSGSGEAQLQHRRHGASLRVEGELVAPIHSACARCGEEVGQRMSVSVSAVFRPEAELSETADDLHDDEGLAGCELSAEVMEEVGYRGEVIDLATWLRDEWRLGMPLALHCPDGVCREAAASEPEPPVDPRWAGLKALRDQLE